MPGMDRVPEGSLSGKHIGIEKALAATRKHHFQAVGGQTLRFKVVHGFTKQFRFHHDTEPTHAPIESDLLTSEECRWDDDGGQGFT